MRFLFALVLLAAPLAATAEVSAIYGDFAPTGTVSAPKPELRWKLTPTGGGQVTRVEMLLNRKRVEATFNPSSNEVEYSPAEPLEKGLYAVVCNVTINRAVVARQDWMFEVGGSSATIAAALEATNALRRELGLPAFISDQRLNDAAVAHSRYQLLNHETGHFEDPAKPGFTGKAPWDRVQRFGYPGTCFECASGNQMDPATAVKLLFDAPYHRIAFLQPGTAAIGIGFEAGALTLDYGLATDEGAGLSPSPGQAEVPIEWDGNESPSPLRIHGATGSVGYPIVFSWFSPRLEGNRVDSKKLIGPDGLEVPSYLNTPENDGELRFSGVLTPKAKLLRGTTYRVDVRAASQRGKKLDRSWSFTTRS
jgi:uncharacterized protein YkwD